MLRFWFNAFFALRAVRRSYIIKGQQCHHMFPNDTCFSCNHIGDFGDYLTLAFWGEFLAFRGQYSLNMKANLWWFSLGNHKLFCSCYIWWVAGVIWCKVNEDKQVYSIKYSLACLSLEQLCEVVRICVPSLDHPWTVSPNVDSEDEHFRLFLLRINLQSSKDASKGKG